ncbi:hypothetical protein Cagg_3289 [Chloroflexus aggregans DSM 9485]|uniref:Uncharacterized protein n=1 Tax=Chloroflexus aggregans (strain MD-66 / DSM 9485) TaxID=326427 RepID=B8G887_CHLAD|nr:hypothetical protein Cagg_3289 [Chloroflexus aggregans DSM 9485]
MVPGTNPTLATHSAELWTLASTMYCYDNGNPTYVKTYLHANTEVIKSHMYLPVVMRDYPPMKDKTGIHLGNRSTDWGSSMLNAIDGSKAAAVGVTVSTACSTPTTGAPRNSANVAGAGSGICLCDVLSIPRPNGTGETIISSMQSNSNPSNTPPHPQSCPAHPARAGAPPRLRCYECWPRPRSCGERCAGRARAPRQRSHWHPAPLRCRLDGAR